MNTATVRGKSQPLFQRALTLLFCFLFVSSNTFSTVAMAQNTGADFEAPIIEHDDVGNGSLGDIETFVASVVDNEAVEKVSLFYRLEGTTAFMELVMNALNSTSYYYSAKIDTAAMGVNATAIEYYIRAEDSSGNLVLKGFAFEPLVRPLVPANSFANTNPASTATDQAPATAAKSKINWVYLALGALLIGGIAAGASGGGSEGGEPTGDCTTNCQVTLTISPP